MLFDESLQDICIQNLKSGSTLLTDLVVLIQNQRIGTSKQGIYRAIRELSQKEIIVVHNHKASLNLQWISKISSFSDIANNNYLNPKIKSHFMDLEPGEQITYKFNNANSTDSFWNHAIYVLMEKQLGADFYSYTPHMWFLLVRKKEELALQKYINSLKRKYLITVGSQTKMDQIVGRYFNNAESQYTMLEKPLYNQRNYYINIIGSYLIEVWFSNRFADKIEEWYQKTKDLKPENLAELESIVHTKQKIKLRISNKPEKSQKIIKKLSYFFH